MRAPRDLRDLAVGVAADLFAAITAALAPGADALAKIPDLPGRWAGTGLGMSLLPARLAAMRLAAQKIPDGDYTWFFQNWFFGYNYMDLAVDGVRSEGDVHAVAVRNPGGMALPFDLVLGFADGSSERVHRTPAAWQADGRRIEVRIAGGKALRSVTVDTGIYVDFNPGDNAWTADKAGSH